jgi:hypothetical protein
MVDRSPPAKRRAWWMLWPWLVLVLTAIPAFWHVLDYPNDLDPEYPEVERPTFNRLPPPAYRLAEAGDTIDRVAIYVSAGAMVLAVTGLMLSRGRRGLWLSAFALAGAAFWHASTPGPTFDGWHGLGWRTMFDPSSPAALKAALGCGAILLATVSLLPLLARRAEWGAFWREGRTSRVASLLVLAAVLVALRQVELPGVEPVGYWPRWFFVFGLVAFDLALVKMLPRIRGSYRPLKRVVYSTGIVSSWLVLVVGGIWVTWYHRPLARLHTVVPGKIYLSAMPTEQGLEIAQSRHHFKTIINLFPEDSAYRSDRLPEELRFAEQHGIRYMGSPSEEAESSSFLDETLAVAQDPAAWPILVHCHGCMDRSPAWMGIYRFVVEGRPLNEIMKEIESHRGYRPKASVTLLYNRVLPPRAPERYAKDPTAALLKRCAHGVVDIPPRVSEHANVSEHAKAEANPTPRSSVTTRVDPGVL